VDCPGICAVGDGCSNSVDCVDASGYYLGKSSTHGTCRAPAGQFPVDEDAPALFQLTQTGCSVAATVGPLPLASGTVSGNQLSLSGSAAFLPQKPGCDPFVSS